MTVSQFGLYALLWTACCCLVSGLLDFVRLYHSSSAPEASLLIRLFAARKLSLGQGNIFRNVCQEFCPQGGAWSRGWGCLVPGGCLVRGGGDPRGGYCCGRYASYWNAFLFIVKLKSNLLSKMISFTWFFMQQCWRLILLRVYNFYRNPMVPSMLVVSILSRSCLFQRIKLNLELVITLSSNSSCRVFQREECVNPDTTTRHPVPDPASSIRTRRFHSANESKS